MEDVIHVYQLPYDPDYPLVCMDETNKQLIGEVQAPMACAPGRPALIDHEYVRNGVCPNLSRSGTVGRQATCGGL
jgi:hypothetical protein